MLVYMLERARTFVRQVITYGLISGVVFGGITYAILVSIPEHIETTPVLKEKFAPPELSTDVWGVFDVVSGQVLYGNNIDMVKPIASITKLFTGEVVMKSPHKNDEFIIGLVDTEPYGRAGKLSVGTETSPYELLYPLLIESSNDAAYAIQRTLHEEYEARVATLTQELALLHTRIVEPSGLSPLNVSTVRELARYYVHLRDSEPHLLDITQVETYITPTTGYVNNNPGRQFETFHGGKHGFTDEAGKTFVGSFTSETSRGEVGIVLLKSSDLLRDIQALLAYEQQF